MYNERKNEIRFPQSSDILQELTKLLRQKPWLDAPPRKSGVARRSARGAEPDDPTSARWRVQPRLLTQKRGQFQFYHDHLGRSNQTV